MNQIMKNGKLYEYDQQNLPTGSGLIYEVIRIIERTPLFFDAHYTRLRSTAESTGVQEIPSQEVFRAMVDGFLAVMDKSDYNIKITFDRFTSDLTIFESPSSYPDASLYRTGIHTELMDYRRENPNAKITNEDLTARAARIRQTTGAYEVLLVDSQGRITEGSKSNVFFIVSGMLKTPPLRSVLPGVTRQKILDTVRDMKINLAESEMLSDNIHTCEASFISGTSPKILPIRSIGEYQMDSASHPLLLKIMAAFDQTIDLDLKNYRRG